MLWCPNKYGREAVEFSVEGGATSRNNEVVRASSKALQTQAELFPVPMFLSSENIASFSGATMWQQIGQIMDKIFKIVLYLVLTSSALLIHQGLVVIDI